MEAAWNTITALFTWQMMLYALTGTVLGMLWGAMPALSTTMAMALLVGMTAKMSIHGAIVFLMALMTSSTFGGAITAVLINIPGTPASIPTAMEGYPLTQKGEGGLALGMSIVGSFMGNWIGIIALMIFLPMIMAIAMKFGAWELFLLAFWGIMISGTLVGDEKPLKGWISGWLGLLIAMVGVEPIHGLHRFTFDQAVLIDGVAVIPIIIGLFGMTEIFKALSTPTKIDTVAKPIGRIIPSFSLLRKHLGTMFRASFIGIVIGALPAAGPNIASFLAYIVEKQKARGAERELFGKGSYAGLIASEVSNNACIGGSMLPTITLGIPGSAGMAILLGALNLHAIRVGPAMEIHHPGLIYFFYGALILTNLFMYVIALLAIKPSVKLFTMKKEILMPVILPLCAIGAFGINQSPFELYLMLGTGLIGWAFYEMKYPLAPMIMGVILGPMADENLRKAIIIFQGQEATLLTILSRPVGTIMLIVIALTFYKAFFAKR
jgi:putative tricarboxylic transport membrane protein